MTRRDWWIGVTVVTAAFVFHAAFPRHEWRQGGTGGFILMRIDRWTGSALIGDWQGGYWVPRLVKVEPIEK